MDICNFATTIRAIMSFLWSFINQQPTEMFLGSIVGCFIGWNLFYLGKIPFVYIVVMVIAIVLAILLIWYLGDFIRINIKNILYLLVMCLFCACAFLLSVLLVFGEAVLIFFLVTGAVTLVSLVKLYGFDNIRLVISIAILDKLRNFLISLIGTVCLSGFVVWVPTLMPLLIGKSFIFYLASVAVAFLNMKNMNIIGPSSGEENDLNGLSSTSSELLPPDGTIHYSRQQDLNSQLASTHGQASKELTLGTDRQVPQSFDDHNIQRMTNIDIVEQSSGEDIDLDGLTSTSSELLPPDGTVLYSRQQDVNNQFVSTHGQASQEIALRTGHVQIPPSQKTGDTSVPPSEHNSAHIQDENRSVGQQPPTVPSTFKLAPVRIEQEQPTPPEANPSHLKPSLDQINHQILQSLDDHAIQVSKYEHPSFRELIWDLIFSKNISNEFEKVRVIFRWLATKNLKQIIFDSVEKGSPEEVFLQLKEGKTTYARVFDTMCNYAGLQSTIISGYAKGANYKLGMKFNPDKNKHTWNAVYINGTWGLVDADWAARSIIEKLWKCKYQLNEHFFLPDPNHFICEHFPDDDRWQLLDRPITLEKFENMPHIKPDFFKYGLEFVSHDTVIIYGQDEIKVRLRYPANKVAVDFNFRLQFESGEEEEYKGTKLNRYGMQESVEGIVTFRLRLPIKGSYILTIYAKEDTPEKKDNVYAQVCEYKIVQEEVSAQEPQPFPPCAYLNWGPGTSFYRYGLATYQQTANILTRDGKAELQFRIPKQMQFITKLKHNDRNDADLMGYVTYRIVGNNVYFNITAPSRGEYGLEIHANDPATEGSTIYQVAQYLVDCNEDVKTVSLPKLSAGYLGAKPEFNDYGLNTLSHHVPVIHLEANAVEIQFSVTQEVRVKANLIEVESDREMPGFVFTNAKDSVVSFIINCPSVGFYKLELYAIPVQDPSQQLPGIYNYLINCQRKTENVYPFPIQYAQWTKGCYMWEPLVVHKEIGKPTVNFHVKIPKAENVAVEINQKWTYLQSSQPEIWQGEVNLAPYYGEGVKVTVNANFGGDKTNYSTLLEYSV